MTARLVLLAGLVALIAALVQWRVVDREPAAAADDATAAGLFPDGRRPRGVRYRRKASHRAASRYRPTRIPRAASCACPMSRSITTPRPAGVWHLTSNEARVPPGGRTVEFEGDVRLAGQPGEDPVAAELRTARLQLDTGDRGRRHARARRARLRRAPRARDSACTPTSSPERCAWNPTSMAASHRKPRHGRPARRLRGRGGAGSRAAADPARGTLAGLGLPEGRAEVRRDHDHPGPGPHHRRARGRERSRLQGQPWEFSGKRPHIDARVGRSRATRRTFASPAARSRAPS